MARYYFNKDGTLPFDVVFEIALTVGFIATVNISYECFEQVTKLTTNSMN